MISYLNKQMLSSNTTTMNMKYGFNETDNWWYFALGRSRRTIWKRLKELNTSVIRIFLFDKNAPNPVTEWHHFSSYVQAVLNVGATPMITFAKFNHKLNDCYGLKHFANQCFDVVWGCIEQWGGEIVRDWYWCIWNEPNNAVIGGGLSFEEYREFYQEIANNILKLLNPFLSGAKPRIGGPAIDSFQPFWLDWINRFLTDIDNDLIGFVSWHCYGDWRINGQWDAPIEEKDYQKLLLAKTSLYESYSNIISHLIDRRDILNICEELNVHSLHDIKICHRFNQSIFSAVYYVSAIIHLIKGGVDLEMWWTATDDKGPYGILDKDGVPNPVFYAKKLCSQFLRFGDKLFFPNLDYKNDFEIVCISSENYLKSILIVHLKDEEVDFDCSTIIGSQKKFLNILKIDRCSDNILISMRNDGIVHFNGYGIAVVTSKNLIS